MKTKLLFAVATLLLAAGTAALSAYARQAQGYTVSVEQLFTSIHQGMGAHPAKTANPSSGIPKPSREMAFNVGFPDASHSETGPAVYIIHKGDTLYHLAMLFHTTVKQLSRENGISDPAALQIGERIRLPVQSVKTAATMPDSPIVKVLNATLTAYTAGPESTGKTPADPEYGITYSGTHAREGRTVAVDPSVIPLGSTVYIAGVGIRKAEDIGSAVKGDHIDIFMNNVKRAMRFGVKKNIRVYVLAEPSKSNV